jgi:KDO2-lipid IV(A) lauroyltransferase
MQLLLYIILYPFLFFLSILPFRVIYLLSDLVYFFVYYIFGYRKKVVRQNLALAFPEKTSSERKKIERDFYRHFSDLFMEMIKAFHLSGKQMQERMKFKNVDLLNKISKQNRHIILVGGHYGNWEWIFYLARLTYAQPIGTYLKINNKYFEKFTLKNRKRFGGELIETKKLREVLKTYKNSEKPFLLGLLADQSPQLHRAKYWRKFLGIDVPVFVGPEELAKQYNAAVVFLKIRKIKRGFYEAEFEEITQEPSRFPDYEITDSYLKKLEILIKENPSFYLWTHNRFKHKDRLNEIRNNPTLRIIKE